MKNLKFAIVDSSESFALKIQESLESKAGENSETVIITDRNYLEEFFSEEQKLDVLLIEKKFYSKELETQDIDLICILSDSPEDCKNPNTGYIYNVFRGAGVDKITDTMLSAVNPTMLGSQTQQGNCKVVLVTSPLGGSGKTVAAAAIAYNLKRSGMRVLFVDTTCFQSASYWIGSENKLSDEYIIDNFNHDNSGKIILNGTVDHIAFFSQVLPAMNINTGDYCEIIKSESQKENYDYIVIDSESCFSDDLIKLMTLADYVVILTLQDKISSYKMKSFLHSFECSDASKYIVCCNKFCVNKKNYSNEKQNVVAVSAYMPMFDVSSARLLDISEMKCIQKLASKLL